MYPNQPNQPQSDMPPQVPPQQPQPTPDYGAPVQPAMPQQQPASGYAAPQPAYQPQAAPQPYPQQQPTPAQAAAPAGWYTPPPKPNDDKPASVDAYLHRDQPQNPMGGGNVPGQTVNGQYSIDYLNGISAPAKKPVDMKFIYVGVGAVVAILAAFGLIAMQPKAAPTGVNESKLFAAFVDTSDVTKKASKNIKSSKLVAINSSLNSFLLGAATQMQQPLKDSGQDFQKLNSAAKKPPYHDQKLVDTLEDARLNDVYDNTYSKEMDYKIKNMVIIMDKIQKTNKKKSMKAFIEQTKPNLTAIDKSLEEYMKSSESSIY